MLLALYVKNRVISHPRYKPIAQLYLFRVSSSSSSSSSFFIILDFIHLLSIYLSSALKTKMVCTHLEDVVTFVRRTIISNIIAQTRKVLHISYLSYLHPVISTGERTRIVSHPIHTICVLIILSFPTTTIHSRSHHLALMQAETEAENKRNRQVKELEPDIAINKKFSTKDDDFGYAKPKKTSTGAKVVNF